MPIPLHCSCGARLQVPDEKAGQRIFCPGCKLSLDVPHADEPPELHDVEILEDTEEEAAAETYDIHAADLELEARLGAPTNSTFAGAVGFLRLRRPARCLAYSSSRKFGLAGIGRDILLLDMRDNEKKGRCEEHDVPVTAVAFAPDAATVLSGDERGTLVWWDLKSRLGRKRWRGHRDDVEAAAVAPNGRFAVTGGLDGAVRLWGLETAGEIELFRNRFDEAVTDVAYAPDGRLIAAGTEAGRVAIWSVKTGERIARFKATRPVESVAFAEGGDAVAAVGFDTRLGSGVAVWQWDILSGEPMRVFDSPRSNAVAATALALTPDGKRVLVGRQAIDGFHSGHTLVNVQGDIVASVVASVAAEAIHRGLDRAGQDPALQVYEVATGSIAQRFEDVGDSVASLAVSPDGSRAMVSLENGHLMVYSIPPG